MRQILLSVLGLLLSSAPWTVAPTYLRAHVADWPTWVVPDKGLRPRVFNADMRWWFIRGYMAARLPEDDAARLRRAANPHPPVVTGGIICGTGLQESMRRERMAANALLFLAYPFHTLRNLWMSAGSPRAGPGGILGAL